MKVSLAGACGVVAFSTIALATATSALAQAGDYADLPVNPNVVTDSSAYVAAAPTLNPDGQPGVEALFTHRDGSRTITDTILVTSDPTAASAAVASATPVVVTTTPGGGTEPAQVGSGGTIITGTSPDGTHSVTVVTFIEGGAAAVIEFSGAPGDPVPKDLAVEYAQRQATAINEAGAV